ncbi:uncharacterized protein LOC135486964 isoform X2 [Lineus longissimus]|uniref:uncharacterized protein LOC135486964 isoform X2 n=1 Tax=Lineus longissimus TaxID=88925 RepID=UPI00315CC06E
MSDSMSTDIGLVPDRTTPLERSRRRWSLGCIFIVQALHGVAFYAMSSSLMAIAKTHLKFSNTAAVGTSLAFSACVYVMPSVGGTVGDIQLGRYKTIFYGIALYLLGTVLSLILVVLLNVSKTTPIDVLPMRIVYICSLILVAVSRGFIKTNIIPFGAQQVDQSKSFHITSYFRWSIWFFNIGKFCAYCPLAFFVLNVGITDGLLIQAIVQVVTVGLSVAVFILGKGKYTVSHHVSPPSTGTASIKYLWEVVRSSLSCFKKRQPWDDDTSWTESAETVTKEEKAITRIVFKKICFMLGIFASIGVFETLYFQMTSTYIMQGKSLRHDMEILPKQLMNAFAPCVVLVGVPLTEFVSRKYWSRERRKYKFTELMQMGSGTIFAALSVLCAGIIESAIRTGWDVNVFWQMPQFTLMGMADLLVSNSVTARAWLAWRVSQPVSSSPWARSLASLSFWHSFLLGPFKLVNNSMKNTSSICFTCCLV